MRSTGLNIDASRWVDDYSDKLYRYALIRINNHELARDLVQETFIAALRTLHSFEGRSSVKTWLFSILKRKIIDHWRLARTRTTSTFSSMDTEYETGLDKIDRVMKIDSRSLVDIDFKNKELGEIIISCIQELPDKWRLIVIDSLVEGKKYKEVCEEHEITQSNLWVIIHRAKLQLRDCILKKTS